MFELPQYELLNWDTDFFGYTVARITQPVLTRDECTAVLADLRSQGVHLAYWPTAADSDVSHEAAVKNGGILVDKKTIFSRTLIGIDGVMPERAESYTATIASPALRSLAVQAGLFSRFKVDSKIGYDKFAELYTIWLERSVRREIAKDVLVIRDHTLLDHPEIALATVGEKNGRGDIGLVAVDGHYRGQGLGTTIVAAANTWFVQHNYTTSQVVTQGENAAACRLYEKCGYAVENVEWWYHFWI